MVVMSLSYWFCHIPVFLAHVLAQWTQEIQTSAYIYGHKEVVLSCVWCRGVIILLSNKV